MDCIESDPKETDFIFVFHCFATLSFIEPFLEHIKPLFEKSGKGHIITLDETAVLMHKTGNKM